MLFKDIKIEIPAGVRIQKKDNYYYVYKPNEYIYKKDKKQSIEKRVCIGRVIDDKYMIPNDNFEKYYGVIDKNLSEPPMFSDTLKIGNMLIIQKIIKELNLDELLKAHKDYADTIINLASYMIIKESSAFQHYEEFAYNHNIIGRIYSDSYISNVLNEIKDSEIELFLEAWNKIHTQLEKIYINYDSTNMNTNSLGIELAEYGHAKKDEDLPQVNISYAALSSDSTPLFYEIYPGSIIDNSELSQMASKAKEYGYKNIGFILDRGYYSRNNIEYLENNKYSYILMIKDSNTFVSAFKQEMSTLACASLKNYLDGFNVYGKTFKSKLFKNDKKNKYVHVYYDEISAATERINLLNNVYKLEKQLEKILNSEDMEDKHKSKCERFKNVFNLHYKDEYLTSYSKKTAVIEKLSKDAGYFCLVSSEDLSTSEAIRIYRGRDSVEKLFLTLKSKLDMESFRVQSNKALRSKVHIAFIASIIRNEILNKSKTIKVENKDSKNFTVPAIIKELEKIECTRNINDIYKKRYVLTAKQKKILKAFDIDEAYVLSMVNEINKSNNYKSSNK